MIELLHTTTGAVGAIAAGLITWIALPIQIIRIHKNPSSIHAIEKSIIYLATLSYSAFSLYGLTHPEGILWPLVVGYAPGFFFGSYLIYLIIKYRKQSN